jgi:lysophospholipase L1-like esterase
MNSGAGLRRGAACGLTLVATIFLTMPVTAQQVAQQELARDLLQVRAQESGQDAQCVTPREAKSLEHLPARFRERIAQGLPLTIVAIGSSSTAGVGASSPALTYPAQLEAELKARLPGRSIHVLNKGIGGEEAAQMVARFETDVLDESPDLVVWQVGSNSVLADHDAPGNTIREGVERLKASGTDVVLMNQQYAPKILEKGERALHAVDVITATARDSEVGLFNRFAAMRHWHNAENMSFDRFMTPDGVHMNDWGYGCVAKLLAAELLEGTKLPVATAKVSAGAVK